MAHDTLSVARSPSYPIPARFVAWLAEEAGRAEYFSKVDKGLFPAMISKIKAGRLPITFETAVRLERAQKASRNPLRAEELMTFLEHRTLYRYVTGQDPAPAQVQMVRKNAAPKRTQAGAAHAAA